MEISLNPNVVEFENELHMIDLSREQINNLPFLIRSISSSNDETAAHVVAVEAENDVSVGRGRDTPVTISIGGRNLKVSWRRGRVYGDSGVEIGSDVTAGIASCYV